MLPDVGSFLDRLDNAFGRGYVYAGVIPLAALAGATLLAAYALFVGPRELVAWAVSLDGWRLTTLTGGVLLALALGGFILWSISPALHRLLEGSAFWPVPYLRYLLTERQLQRREAMRADVASRLDETGRFRRDGRDGAWLARLQAALKEGRAAHAADRGRIAVLTPGELRLVAPVRVALQQGHAVAHDAMEAVVVTLEAALRRGAPDKPLEREYLGMSRRYLVESWQLAESAWETARLNVARVFPQSTSLVRPTTLGNLAAVTSEHGLLCYGFDANALWLHLLHAVPSDAPLRKSLDDAKLRLDTCVAFTAVAGAFTLALTPAAVVAGHSPLVLASIMVIGTGLTALFLVAAISESRALGDAVRATVDLYHLEVLRGFRLAAPKSLLEERQRWRDVTRLLHGLDTRQSLDYDLTEGDPKPSRSTPPTSRWKVVRARSRRASP